MEIPQPHLYQSPARYWLILVSLELTLLTLFYFLLQDGWIFFLLGPVLLFNIALWTFPLWYVAFQLQPLYQGALWKKSNSILVNMALKAQIKPTQLLMGTTQMKNALILSHPFKNWLYVDRDFWQSLAEHEQLEILKAAVHVFQHQAPSATLLSGLLYLIPPLRKLLKTRELCFFIDHGRRDWHKLNYKVFHLQQAPQTTFAGSALTPSLLFPSLTVYRQERYFALHKYLRDMYIECLNPNTEVIHVTEN